MLRYILVFYLLIYVGVDKKFIKKFLIIIFFVLIIQSGLGLSQLILPESFSQFLAPDTSQGSFGKAVVETGIGEWNISQRISGTFGRYDKFGIFLSFFLTLAIGIYYHSKKFSRFYLNLIFLSIAVGRTNPLL